MRKNKGIIRTDMYCHDCDNGFIAELNYSIDGNHVVECPHCGHEHCRVIEDGEVTGERWDSRFDRADYKRRVWKHDILKMKTSMACSFIREKWLNFGVSEE